jgi:endonuclease YncB( thermonuclease family)
MPRFITRVELHAAIYQDYETLHAEMKKLKFFRTIQDTTTNQTFHLPTAEYWSNGDTITVDQVAKLAEIAAKTTGKKYSIITVKSAGVSFINLDPAKVMA